MCEFCTEPIGKDMEVVKYADGCVINAFIHNTKSDTPGIVILTQYGEPCGYFEINYCPMCGERLE